MMLPGLGYGTTAGDVQGAVLCMSHDLGVSVTRSHGGVTCVTWGVTSPHTKNCKKEIVIKKFRSKKQKVFLKKQKVFLKKQKVLLFG